MELSMQIPSRIPECGDVWLTLVPDSKYIYHLVVPTSWVS